MLPDSISTDFFDVWIHRDKHTIIHVYRIIDLAIHELAHVIHYVKLDLGVYSMDTPILRVQNMHTMVGGRVYIPFLIHL